MSKQEVVDAWDRAVPAAIHPARNVSEEAYWASGEAQAAAVAGAVPSGSTILDFGCGDGRVAIPLHRRGFSVVAVDSSRAMLGRLAAAEPAVATVWSDGSDLVAQLPRPVDTLLCLAVLIHHDWVTGTQLVDQLRRCVRPGGLLILDWPTSEHPEERAHWIGVTTWAPARQAAVADELGLQRVDRGLPWPTFVVGA